MGAYIGGQKLEPKILSKIQDITEHTAYDILGKTTISTPQTITCDYYDGYMYICFMANANWYTVDDIYGSNKTAFPALADIDVDKFTYEDLQIYYTLKTDTSTILISAGVGNLFTIEKMTATSTMSGVKPFGYKITSLSNDKYILGASFLLKYDGKYVSYPPNTQITATGSSATTTTNTGTTSGSISCLDYSVEKQIIREDVANCPSNTDIQSYLNTNSTSTSTDCYIKQFFVRSSGAGTVVTITIDGVSIYTDSFSSFAFDTDLFGPFQVGYKNIKQRWVV